MSRSALTLLLWANVVLLILCLAMLVIALTVTIDLSHIGDSTAFKVSSDRGYVSIGLGGRSSASASDIEALIGEPIPNVTTTFERTVSLREMPCIGNCRTTMVYCVGSVYEVHSYGLHWLMLLVASIALAVSCKWLCSRKMLALNKA